MLLHAHCWLQFLLEWPDCGSHFSFEDLVPMMSMHPCSPAGLNDRRRGSGCTSEGACFRELNLNFQRPGGLLHYILHYFMLANGRNPRESWRTKTACSCKPHFLYTFFPLTRWQGHEAPYWIVRLVVFQIKNEWSVLYYGGCVMWEDKGWFRRKKDQGLYLVLAVTSIWFWACHPSSLLPSSSLFVK